MVHRPKLRALRSSLMRLLTMESSGSESECVSAVSQCEETEEDLHPPETTLRREHGTQTEAQSDEQLLEDALMMEISESESDYWDWMSGFRTGNEKAFDSGVSLESDKSKEEIIFFKRRQRMSSQSEDSCDSDWSEEIFPPLSRSVESDNEVSYKDDGSDNLWSPCRVLLRPIGSSRVSVRSDRSERQRRRRSKRIRSLSEAGWKHGGGTSQEAPAGPVCSTVSVAVSTY